MKNIILGAIAAFALSACVTAADVDKDEQMDAAQAVEMKADKKTMECAVPGPNDTCACKKVDANGDCVEGGGPAVIIQRQSVCAVPAPDGGCACGSAGRERWLCRRRGCWRDCSRRKQRLN